MKTKMLIAALLTAAAPLAHATTVYEVTSDKALSCRSNDSFDAVRANPANMNGSDCVYLPHGTRVFGYAVGTQYIKTSPFIHR